MSTLTMWNGEFVSSNNSASKTSSLVPLHTLDRAWNYGQGVFETIRVLNGQPQWLDLHLQRLEKGARALSIPLVSSQIRQEIQQFLERVSERSGTLKIMISPIGVRRSYRMTQSLQHQRCIQWFPFSTRTQFFSSARIVVCNEKLANNSKLAGIKHNSRLDYVMAFEKVKTANADEGLLLNDQEFIVEALQANIFWIWNDILCTPSLEQAGVAGVMRKIILQTAQELNLKVNVANFSLQDIWQSNFCFLSNTHYGLRPVHSLSISPQNTLIKAPTTCIKKWSMSSENSIFSQLLTAIHHLDGKITQKYLGNNEYGNRK